VGISAPLIGICVRTAFPDIRVVEGVADGKLAERWAVLDYDALMRAIQDES